MTQVRLQVQIRIKGKSDYTSYNITDWISGSIKLTSIESSSYDFVQQFIVKEQRRIGDRFRYNDEVYLLSCCNQDEVVLINTRNGKRYKDSIAVNDTKNITDDDWEQICGNISFERIGDGD